MDRKTILSALKAFDTVAACQVTRAMPDQKPVSYDFSVGIQAEGKDHVYFHGYDFTGEKNLLVVGNKGDSIEQALQSGLVTEVAEEVAQQNMLFMERVLLENNQMSPEDAHRLAQGFENYDALEEELIDRSPQERDRLTGPYRADRMAMRT